MSLLVAWGEFSAKPHANKQFGTSEEGVRNSKIRKVVIPWITRAETKAQKEAKPH